MLVSWNGHGEAMIELDHKVCCDEVVHLSERATIITLLRGACYKPNMF